MNERIFLDLGQDIFLSIKNFWDHFAHENNFPVDNVFCIPDKMVIDIDGDVTVCNRDVLKSTVVANIYKDNLESVFTSVSNSINKISAGCSEFEFCRYCTGAPTKRGSLIRNTINRYKISAM